MANPLTSNIPKFENVGAVVLCGGQSQRMGYPKWKLPVGSITILDHIVQSIDPLVSPIVVCCGSELIEYARTGVRIVLDENKNCGPLEGMRAGLANLVGDVDLAFMFACDSPYVVIPAMKVLYESISTNQAVMPVSENRVYAMNGLYRVSAHNEMAKMIAAGNLRVQQLANQIEAEQIGIEQIKTVDPSLDSLANINRPAEYLALLESLNLQCDPAVLRSLRLNH